MKAVLTFAILFISTINLFSQINLDNLKNAKISIPGSFINTDELDYGPTVSGDGRIIFYVTNREGSVPNSRNSPSHDFWVAFKVRFDDDTVFSIIHPNVSKYYEDGFNTDLNEGGGSLSQDGKCFYFTACNRPGGSGACDIYMAKLKIDQDEIYITHVEKLNNGINTQYFESLPSISPDNKKLFFVSVGKSMDIDDADIYCSEWNDIISDWEAPYKLSDVINTDLQENSPYMCPDNRTLIFSSAGHKNGNGELDYYYSVFDSVTKTWSEPQNLGKPLNTHQDDRFITINATGEMIYFSSDRTDINNSYDGLNIFQAKTKPLFDEITLISWQLDKHLPVKITIYNDSDSAVKVLGFPKKPEGRYSFYWDCLDKDGKRVPPGKYFYEIEPVGLLPEPARPLIVK